MWLCRALLPCLGDDEMHDHHRFADEMPRRPSYRPRPEEPPVLGHRFSPRPLPSSPLLKPFSPPTSPRQSVYLPFPAGPAEPSAPRVLVLDPGSGETCNALQGLVHIHLAVAPEFDLQVKRYPPGWRSMVGVKLTEAEAAAASKVVISGVRSAWPSVDDLRGPAHPCNLATWASTLFDKRTNLMRSVDLTATGCDRWSARHAKASRRATSEFDCLVCGSRGGEVTLPALWLLGCRMPAVVINGGCAREKAGWLWPPGVYVVLLTGGRDRICNEYFAKQARANTSRTGTIEQLVGRGHPLTSNSSEA
ncbi:hypothetical protein AB1Y20_004531 [Prymnesium parvum]|uniref:Exostosin GT47 domain-containing protein n=1 Tax=Prymnesium parvum TaxID=97485 RepID=A0AB34IXS2_PRYPA